MEIRTNTCDRCGTVCRGDYMTVYRNSGRSVIAKEEICENCYRIMSEALEPQLTTRPAPVIDLDRLDNAVETFVRIERIMTEGGR